mgnify:FL=1
MPSFTNDQTDNNTNHDLVNNNQQIPPQPFPGPPIGGLTRSVNLPFNEERSEDVSCEEEQNFPLPLCNYSVHN